MDWTFDFDHADSDMKMTYDTVNKIIHIFGDTYGGVDIGGGSGEYDSSKQGLFEVDFTYDHYVSDDAGGGVLDVTQGHNDNKGTIKWLSSPDFPAPAVDDLELRGGWRHSSLHGFSARGCRESDFSFRRGPPRKRGFQWLGMGRLGRRIAILSYRLSRLAIHGGANPRTHQPHRVVSTRHRHQLRMATATTTRCLTDFIPEPTTLTLAVLGLLGCAVRWRRGRR